MALPTPTDLEVVRRLAQSAEGRLLVQVFQSRLVELDKVNRRAIGENVFRGQGRALELEEILTDVLGATEASPAPLQHREPKRQQSMDRFRVNHMAVVD